MSGMTIPYSGSAEIFRTIVEEIKESADKDGTDLSFDVERHLADLQLMIMHPACQIFVLTGYGSQHPIDGYIAMEAWQNPSGDQVIANERYWYVTPKSRAYGARKLLKVATEWAKTVGAGFLFCTASYWGSDRHDKLQRLYTKLGMQEHQTIYRLRLE